MDDNSYNAVNSSKNKAYAIILLIVAIILILVVFVYRKESNYKLYEKQVDYYAEKYKEYSNESKENKELAREYIRGSFFYDSYMLLASQYEELCDDALEEIRSSKRKMKIINFVSVFCVMSSTTMIIWSIVLFNKNPKKFDV